VSTAVLDGKDPYELFGYNYPPPWLVTLALIKAVTHSTETFRLGISLLLIVIDLGIALLLLRRGYGLAACLFLLSPVVIAISGQHQQVEGIAVFFALASAVWDADSFCCVSASSVASRFGVDGGAPDSRGVRGPSDMGVLVGLVEVTESRRSD
jgi:hypothetical protein